MPFVQSKNPVIQDGLAQALLAALSARPAGALLATPKVMLYKAGPASPTRNQLVSDFTVADFDGYANFTLPALTGPINCVNRAWGIHGEADFNGATPQTHPQNIIGYIVVDTTLAILYAAEAFPSVIPITGPGDFISLDVVLSIDSFPTAQTA